MSEEPAEAVPVNKVDDLTGRIDATRLLYTEADGGVSIEGAPFTVEFQESVTPEVFCHTISTAEDPWRMFGIPHPIKTGYWKLVGVLLHTPGGELDGSSKITLEVAPEWVRVYVDGGASVERIADFVRTLDSEYGVEVRFPDD